MSYVFRAPLRDEIIKHLLNAAEGQGIAVAYDAVWGDMFGGINFSQLRIVQDGNHYIEVERLHLTYRLLPMILEKRLDVRSIRLIRPHARWLLPEPDTTKETEPFDPNFSLDLAKLNIRNGYIELADTLIFKDIDLNTRLQIRPHMLKGRLRRSNLKIKLNATDRLTLRSAQCDFAYSAPDTIHMDNLAIFTLHSLLKGSIHIDAGNFNATLKQAKIDLNEAAPQNLNGFLYAKGIINKDSLGYGGNCSIELKNFSAPQFSLADLSLKANGKSGKFNIGLSASDKKGLISGYGSLNIFDSSITADISVDELILKQDAGLPMQFKGKINLDYDFVAERANARLQANKAVIFPEGKSPISFEGQLDAIYEFITNQGSLSGNIQNIKIQNINSGQCRFNSRFSGGKIDVDSLIFKDDLTQIRASGTFSSDTLTGFLDIQNFKLASLGSLNPLGKGIAADVNGQLKLEGSDSRPLISGALLLRSDEAFFSQAYVDMNSFDPVNLAGKANFSLSGISGLGEEKINLNLKISDAYLHANASAGKNLSLTTDGALRLSTKRQEIRYDCNKTLLVAKQDTVENRFPFTVGYEGDSLYLTPVYFFVGDGELGTFASWRSGELPRWELSLHGVNLEVLQELLGLPQNSSGRISAQIASRGVGNQKTILIQAFAADLNVDMVQADSVEFMGELDMKKLNFTLSALNNENESKADGKVYYKLNDTSLVQHFNINLDINDIGTWPFFFLKNILNLKQGLVTAKLNVSGNLAQPDIKGWLRIKNGTVYVPIVNLTSTATSAELLFRNGEMILDKMEGTVGKGTIRGRGNYLLFTPPYPYFFSFSFKDIFFSSNRHIHAICGGTLSLENRSGEYLDIRGDINLKEAFVTYGLTDEIKLGDSSPRPTKKADAKQSSAPFPTYIDISITGSRNIWLRNDMMQVEVVPDIKIVQKDNTGLRLTGWLQARQGRFYYLDHVFRIRDDSRISFAGTQDINPEFDLWAVMPTSEIHERGGKQELIKIIVHMSGTLSAPIIEFYSDPPVWSESEIITYLHLRKANLDVTNMDIPVSDLLGGYIGVTISDYLRKQTKLDIFTIENLGVTDSIPTKVTVGKYFGNKWFISYTLALSQGRLTSNQHEFRVEYNINENQDIILERDDFGRHSLRYQVRIRY